MSDLPQRTLLRTMWIGFFLGPFGVHRFYTGFKGSAWFQFLTCGLTTVWLAADVIQVFNDSRPFPDASVAFITEHWLKRIFQFSIWGVGIAYVSLDMARIVAGRFKDALGRPLLTSGEPDKP